MRLYAAEDQVSLGFETRQRAPKDANEIEAQHEGGERPPCCEPHGQRKLLKKIEAILRPATFDIIRSELEGLSIGEITISEVRTCGRQDVRKQFYRGAQYDVLLPKVKVEMLVHAPDLADVIEV